MRANSYNQPVDYMTYNYYWKTWSGPTPQGSITYSFTFSGFGNNPDPAKKLPVAGSYTKQKVSPMKGNWSNVQYYTSNGQLASGTGLVGYHGQHGDYLSYYDLNWTHLSRANNKALDKLWDKVKQTESNLALTLGEWRETAKMLRVGESVYQVLVSARKAKRDFLMNPSRSLSSYWLSYKYGWQPAMMDVWNYVNWTYHGFDNMAFKARARDRNHVDDTRVSSYGSDSYGNSIKSRVTGDQVRQVEYELRAGVSDPAWFTASRVTSMNPASIAWELMPLSFVVDWFYDVGGFLQNVENALGTGLTFKGGYKTELLLVNVQDRWSGMYKYPPQYGYQSILSDDSTSYKYYVWKNRSLLTGFPYPSPPVLNVKLGWQRMLSATALIRTVLLGGVKGKRV